MAEEKMIRLSQAARELKVGVHTILDVLAEKGFDVENNPNAKITYAQLEMLADEFDVPMEDLKIGNSLNISAKYEKTITTQSDVSILEKEETNPKVEPEKESNTAENVETIRGGLKGLTVLGKMDLDKNNKKTEKEEKIIVETKEPTVEPEKESKISIEKTELVTQKTDEILEQQVEKVEVLIPIENSVIENIESIEKEINLQVEVQENLTDKKITAQKEVEDPIKEEISEVQITPPIEQKNELIVEEIPQNLIQSKLEKEPETFEKTESIKENITFEPTIEIIENKNTEQDTELIEAKAETLRGLKVLGKIDLPDKNKKINKPVASSDDKEKKKRKRKKKRIKEGSGESNQDNQKQNLQNTQTNQGNNQNNANNSNQKNQPNNNNNQNKNQNQNQNQSNNKNQPNNNNNQNKNQSNNNNNRNQSNNNRPQNNQDNRNRQNNKQPKKQPVEVSDKEIQAQIKETLRQLNTKDNKNTKRPRFKDKKEEEVIDESKILKVAEFVSVNDIASLMNVSVTQVISACLSLGMIVSINQRLDAEVISFIAAEFGFEAEFINAVEESEEEEQDADEDLETRAPIVTIMGHVDHGKTSLLDYIRRSNVAAKESGGITQHIGAYDVITSTGKRIAFLDTPGHEAFTAMRARGAKVTDVVILVVAADDSVMPQTKEAINHAKVAGVPIVIAINKIDKPTAKPEKIREELANENILVESWGGKYQDQEISAKTGLGVEDLLEKVLLEAEILDLKANPNRKAIGTVIEASLDKGKGYVTTVLVQNGTLKVGDIILAGSHYGRVKAMNDHRGNRLKEVGPSTPVQVLGLDGAPQAGDVFKVMSNEREAREIASKREQILREQNIRATKGLTLEEIGRRRALGNFKELKIIIKGDFDGSVEALTDSLLKLSTPEIAINVIHKAVGQITEADVMLASASEAIIVGFQVRPSPNAKKAAEQEKIQIKLYSIIYNAIEEIKDAMEGMLAPKVEEVITGNVEIRNIFKISKIGTVAGCYVLDGYIKKNNKIRLIRDGIVVYEGEIGALKRFKDDVMEVKFGFECGLSIKNFNDLKEGDLIECFEEREIKRTL